ncbi:ABC transporter ATP-binding protein [Pelagibacteraceae bacterium]|nr:ABC transporter ATP-binding protein [Pelagibacteraceae bacterium]
MELAELIKILKRLYRDYVKKHLKRIVLALALSLIVAGSTSSIAWLLDPAVKKIFIEKDKVLTFIIPIAIIFAFSAKGISLYFTRINLIHVAHNISGTLQKQIANKILYSDIQTIESKHSGKYISNVMYDAGQVQQLVSAGVLTILKDTFTLIMLTGVMFFQNWKLALFALLMMPLAATLAKSLGKRIGKVTIEAADMSGNLTKFLSEILKGSKMIKIYQKEEAEKENAKKVVLEFITKQIKIASIVIRATPIMEILTGFMIAGFIYFSGKLIDAGELEVQNFFSFLAAMMLAYQPIRSLATINMLAYQGGSAAKRIFELIDAPIQIKEEVNLPDVKLEKTNIEFKDVSFKYLNSKDKAINNIDLNIKGGSITAFVGHSGAGKSTIISLLPRFYDPQKGEILIDGQNIREISLKSLRKHISLVSQDVILFDDTIRENIAFAKPNASDNEIFEACKFAAADEFIKKLPYSYETMIGENGVRLSGGQKQRISIARAILKKSAIILLDEATSSLDADSEEIVQNAITNLTKNKTTLVIAHRLSTIHNADQIYVLKMGKIIDKGNHSELISNCDEYKSLYQKQLK